MMEFRDEQERLIAEQAVLQYRAVNEAADRAAFGHGMEAIEDAALEGCREHGRRLIESALRRRALSEKARPARGAGAGPTSNG